MIVIIAGSRTISDMRCLEVAIRESHWEITCVVSGACPDGVDALGEEWARGRNIPVKRFPADWKKGRKAGPIRNSRMAEYIVEHAKEWGGCGVIAVWDGKSRGTKDMVQSAGARGVPVHKHLVQKFEQPAKGYAPGIRRPRRQLTQTKK